MQYLTFLSLVFSSLTIVNAHTWVDNIKVTGGTGPIDGSLGFIRGYIGHSDAASSYRIDKPQQSAYKDNQRQPNQPDPKFQRLKASPGSEITAEWHENGHTTNDTPENNAPGYDPGKVYMYGTTLQPSPDLTLEQIWTWKGDSSLEGRYLGSFNYDDGMCAEEGSQGKPRAIPRWAAGGGGPCKGKFNLPQDLPPGKPYTVFWVWNFSGKVPGGQHFEWYTSVMDIDIVAKVRKRTDDIPPTTTEVEDDEGTEDDNEKDGDADDGKVSKRTVDDESVEDDANSQGDDTVGKVGRRDHGDEDDDASDNDDDDTFGKVGKRDHEDEEDDASDNDDDDTFGKVDKRDHEDEDDDTSDNDDDDTVGKVGKRDDESAEDGANSNDEDDIVGNVNKRTDDNEGLEGDANEDDTVPEQPPLIKRSAKFRAAW